MKNNQKTDESLNFADIYAGLTEHSHQVELFAWSAVAKLYGLSIACLWANSHPLHAKRKPPAELVDAQTLANASPELRLTWLHAIPNGGSRGNDSLSAAIVGARMRAEGVLRGVPDIFLPWPSPDTGGLYIELKKPSQSETALSKEQRLFRDYARQVGYGWHVCFGYVEAINVICEYLGKALPAQGRLAQFKKV